MSATEQERVMLGLAAPKEEPEEFTFKFPDQDYATRLLEDASLKMEVEPKNDPSDKEAEAVLVKTEPVLKWEVSSSLHEVEAYKNTWDASTGGDTAVGPQQPCSTLEGGSKLRSCLLNENVQQHQWWLQKQICGWQSYTANSLLDQRAKNLLCGLNVRGQHGTSVFVHAVVMAASSPTLLQKLIDDRDMVLELDLERVCMAAILDFMYTGVLALEKINSLCTVKTRAEILADTIGRWQMPVSTLVWEKLTQVLKSKEARHDGLHQPLYCVHIQCSDWIPTLLSNLSRFQQQGTLCDADIISSEGDVFPAHVCMIAAANPLLCTGYIPEGSTRERYRLTLPVSTVTVQHLISAIYRGMFEVEVSEKEKTLSEIRGLGLRVVAKLNPGGATVFCVLETGEATFPKQVDVTSCRTVDGTRAGPQTKPTATDPVVNTVAHSVAKRVAKPAAWTVAELLDVAKHRRQPQPVASTVAELLAKRRGRPPPAAKRGGPPGKRQSQPPVAKHAAKPVVSPPAVELRTALQPAPVMILPKPIEIAPLDESSSEEEEKEADSPAKNYIDPKNLQFKYYEDDMKIPLSGAPPKNMSNNDGSGVAMVTVSPEPCLEKETVTCEVCNLTFHSKHDMSQHYREEHYLEVSGSEQSLKCPHELCYSTFVTAAGLVDHLRHCEHSERNQPCGERLEKIKRKWNKRCPHCNQAFSQGGWLKHQVTNACGFGFICGVCRMSFEYKDQLRKHCKIHDQSVAQCPKCPCVMFLSDLERHCRLCFPRSAKLSSSLETAPKRDDLQNDREDEHEGVALDEMLSKSRRTVGSDQMPARAVRDGDLGVKSEVQEVKQEDDVNDI